MSNIDKLIHESALKKIKAGIAKRGFECVTFISDENGEQHPYHYSVGLAAMGFAEIFISGRLPQETAYAFIEKMVDTWKAEKGVMLGKFGPFKRLVEKVAHKMVSRKATVVGHFPAVARQRNGAAIPMTVRWVSVDERRQAAPSFMSFVYEVFPDQKNIPVVQLLWPDDHGQLPDSPHYTGDEEYKQELLPVRT